MKFTRINAELGISSYQAMGSTHVYTVTKNRDGWWKLHINTKKQVCGAFAEQTIAGKHYPAGPALHSAGERLATQDRPTKREAVQLATAFEAYEGWDGSTYGRLREAQDDAHATEMSRHH